MQVIRQLINRSLPEPAAAKDPFLSFAKRFRHKAKPVHSAVDMSFDQARIFENLDVFGYRRLREAERLPQLTGSTIGAPGQHGQHLSSGSIAKRVKGPVQRMMILNSHMAI